ncbi:MAG TPA: flavin reductase family protein, partial [Sphingomicrobium sp.]|nr:flavin reductase family protein [Sphingomicrobium sp.]
MAEQATTGEYRSGHDPRTLRDALGCFVTGVTVVTCLNEAGDPAGLTVNSFTSVSLDPPLLLVCLYKEAASAAALTEASHFAINVLQTGQQPASIRFSTRDEDRFGATRWA